MSASVASASLQ